MKILRKLMTAMIPLFVATGIGPSFAEVRLELKDPTTPALLVYGTISKNDGDYVVQHQTDFSKVSRLWVFLNSNGGDVEAAMQIGRIIRDREAFVTTQNNAKCFSSCALIYIAGVTRQNPSGVIGLHRPYLAASLSREAIERAAPIMLQRIKDYVREMGVGDSFYEAMVNTEVSDTRLYHGNEIKKLVPETDPAYDEIENGYEARRYGVSAAEMRLRKTVVKQRCQPLFSDSPGALGRVMDCEQAIYWGLDDVTYKRVAKNGFPQCAPSEEDLKIYQATDIKKRRDLPFYIKQETCIRDAMHSAQ
jgi:hypothetical protein